MESYYYTCGYCKKEFVPRRRKVQKFCSNSCRTRHHQDKNKKIAIQTENKGLGQLKPLPKTKVEQISLAGVGNAVIANVATGVLKHITFSEDYKTATKGDLKALEAKLKDRYTLIKNHPQKPDGSLPYFDSIEKKIVYFKYKPLNL